MHSEALEPHSLFCTVYSPPATLVACSVHSVVAALAVPAATKLMATAVAAPSAASAAHRLVAITVDSFPIAPADSPMLLFFPDIAGDCRVERRAGWSRVGWTICRPRPRDGSS